MPSFDRPQFRPQRPMPPRRPAPPGPALPPVDTSKWRTPWVWLKYHTSHPVVYPAMIRDASAGAKAGDWVNVYDKTGSACGNGLWNPRSKVPLRLFHSGEEFVEESHLVTLLDRAISHRIEFLNLSAVTDAFRVVHSDADGLSGLVVDKFADVLSVQVHSFGIFQRIEPWIARMHERLGTKRAVFEVDETVVRNEGISTNKVKSDPVRAVKIREHGIRYEVDFNQGHKTGFFCDQRDNRLKLSRYTKGKRVLDLCCYSGGFSISAMLLGGATEATGVDLDEAAVAMSKRNANLNQVRVNWVDCDAFSYARQMRDNGELWDVVILDPPKLIHSRDDEFAAEGRQRYEDLNGLGMVITKPGGLLVTCSCSGMLSTEEFEDIVCRMASRTRRRLQIIDRTGPGEDHPVMSNCPESRYLKVIWARVW
jgi:23S rRNA (cytosine1962-C5)-methyltransferase